MRTIDQMVQSEVLCCASHIVATLAAGYGAFNRAHSADPDDLGDLIEQAFNLACPIDDWEEAAYQAGWTETNDGSDGGPHVFTDSTDGQTWACADWRDLCEDHDLDPYQREVFEHWFITEWLADKLEAKGEKVDRDFGGLCVWARTTSGQGIASDYVIEQIYSDTVKGA